MENVLKNKTKIKSGNNFNLQKIKFNFFNKGNGVILSISINKNNLELTKLLIILNNKNSEMINDFLMDWSPLQYAIFHGNLDIVKLLLENGANINLQNNNGNNALITAVENGHTDIVKLLLKNGADINHQNKFGITPLITAATYGELDIMKLLLEKGANINHQNKFGITPLITAASHDKLEIVKLLLENGATINLTDKNGNTALITAATYGKLDIVKLLLEKGAAINLTDENGNTALITAATYDYEKIVKLLLANGAINSHLVKNSNTPLLAAGNTQIEILKLLLANGADINLQNNNGNNALITAVENGHTDIVKLLLKNGADINHQNKFGITPLITAVENSHTDIVKLLLAKGFNINLTDKNDNTSLIIALITAATYDYEKIVKLLLKNGADINLQLKHNGNTALIAAASFGNIEIVKLLLANGADINLQNNNGNTALYYTICNDYIEVKDLLKNFQDLKNKIELFKKQLKKPQNKEQITKIEKDLQESQKKLETLLQPANNEIRQNQSTESNSNSNTNVSGYQSQDTTNETQNQNTKTTNQNNLYDVPSDNSCLFWAVSTSYLLQVRNNNEEFRSRFIQLFGSLQLSYLSYVQNLLQQFDVENNTNTQTWYQDQIANNLVINVFRNRVVDYIRDNLDNPTQINSGTNQIETFRSAIQISENEIDTNYLERMRQSSAWGGQLEILAIGNLLGSNINANNRNIFATNNPTENIQIFHVNNGTHYNFALSKHTIEGSGINSEEKTTTVQNQQKLIEAEQPKKNVVISNQSAGSNNTNVPVANKPINKNIVNSQTKTTKIINKYNYLSKDEKLKRLNEINRYYQTLSENDKKTFKEKLTNTGLAALSGGTLTAYGTKMTVSGTAATSVTNAEAMEMTPLLSTSTTESLSAAETITVAETAAVEGGVIAGETGTAAALAPETLGLSLVIGGLAIAGTWMYFAFHHHATSDIALPTSIHHNVYDNIEKWYKFLAHDKLKIKINKNTWNEIKQNKNSQATITKIIKNKFIINDHSGWGGSVTNEDFNTLVKVMLLHFEQINGYFEILDNENDGFVIITNTEGDWLGIE
ncbi:ankyrin repeat domain-containing protein [Spiroplasma endosymbiont of Lonchoptera lutea]|uniref:ankyrin repeat domain-containing protein n=1 Tax=Spiroplasma endosymbiont of Lonchoptera lutea TaxID=3066297 RepID=UPI0030CDB4A9